jgi:ribosomal protein S18 acetylase RimI-like enzyme
MPELTIRSYEETDEAQVADLWREVFPDPHAWNDPHDDIRRKLTVQRELFLVALHGETLVGTAIGGYDGHRGWVYSVAVSPSAQRHGIGSALMHRVEADLARIGCHKLNLQVRASNHEVVAFYKSLGYKVEERVSMGKLLDNVDG